MKTPELTSCQAQGISYALKNPYCILALDPGLGKSRCAIEVREMIGGNCLVICPSYLVSNWVNEIRRWAPPDRVVTAIKKGSEIYDLVDSDYAIISYDLAQKAESFFEWADIVVLDEGHNIKSQKAKRTQFIHRVVFENSIKRLMILTGTPIKNRVEEFYSLLAICNYDPSVAESQFLGRFPSSIDFADYFSYREQYTIEIGFRLVTIMKWTGLRRVEELRQYLEGHYLRIKSEDVLDLPPIVFKDFQVSSTPDLDLLNSFKSHFEKEDGGSVNPTAKAQAALKKVPFTVKYVENLLEETDCALVYSDHIEASDAIAKALNTKALNGRMPAHRRMELANKFQQGEGQILVATIGSLSTGVNLTRSKHIVLNDYPWVPGDVKQTIYRIQRLGQNSRCFVHRIIGSPQDLYIMETLDNKQKIIDRAT